MGYQERKQADSKRAANMKAAGEERTTGRCAQCYQMIACDSPKSRRTHVCGGSQPTQNRRARSANSR